MNEEERTITEVCSKPPNECRSLLTKKKSFAQQKKSATNQILLQQLQIAKEQVETIAELLRDKDRLDWLLENAVIETHTTWHPDDYIKFLTRADIDAAMKDEA